jgi:hypothetical protein
MFQTVRSVTLLQDRHYNSLDKHQVIFSKQLANTEQSTVRNQP